MRIRHLVTALLLALAAAMALPSAVLAGEPPNQNDPCGDAGRDTCGTTGIGFYDSYRYGVRWFGDFRGAVTGVPLTFCIDLRYWYPSRSYQYREDTSGSPLRNREGKLVPTRNLQKMSYAMWAFGRSRSQNQQAAVMLYVHSLMGDAAPGEVDPAAISSAVASIAARVERDAARYHGPYRIETELAERLTVARKATATVRVVSATGTPMPGLRLTVTAQGAGGAPEEVRTNSAGVARVSLTPTAAAGLRLSFTSEPMASTLPRLFTPSRPAPARNGQRLAAPASQRLTTSVTRQVAPARPLVTTAVTAAEVLVGAPIQDKVTIARVGPEWKAAIGVEIHGPFRSSSEIRCDATPAWTGTLAASGPGESTTPAATLAAPGWYTYRLVIPGSDDYAAVTTPCGEPSESFKVQAQPAVTTVVSAPVIRPGTPLSDTVEVSGLSGERAVVKAALYGPFPSADKITCDGAPIWTGSIEVAADGRYQTEQVVLTVPGYYTYRESIDATELMRPVQTACAEAAETAIVAGAPQVTTAVSSLQTKPGAKITDKVVVTGLGVLTATVQVELWGPFPSREAITCEGTPYWTGTLTAAGDGTYTTEPATLDRAGYYTYRESIAGAPAHDATVTACGDVAETTFAKATPTVTTVVSDEVVRPGSAISDTIKVSGLGKTPAVIDVELFGPFASREAIRCDVAPFWTGRVTARGDGTLTSPAVRITRAGFYTYRERLIGSPVVTEVTTRCGEVAETSLGAPSIVTGRGEITLQPRAPHAGGTTPTRISISRLGLTAPVSPSTIDLARGILGVPANINRAGWWRDGAAPGARTGSILIAGHVDSARRGAGAFFRLPQARTGDIVQVATADGRTRSYRVTSVRTYLKSALPTDVWAQSGPARLVVVTCGGPFDVAAGHYRDNVVVTAVPA